jgi:negative regulator of flagellin synthesis FlgM
MAIDLKNIDLASTASSSTSKTSAPHSAATRAAGADTNAKQPSGSEVNITSTAALLANVQNTLASQPAVDQNRVDSISKSISDGTYTVRPDSIANGLIQTERALGHLKGY